MASNRLAAGVGVQATAQVSLTKEDTYAWAHCLRASTCTCTLTPYMCACMDPHRAQ